MYIEGLFSFGFNSKFEVSEKPSTVLFGNGFVDSKDLDRFFGSTFIIGSERTFLRNQYGLSEFDYSDNPFSFGDFKQYLANRSDKIGLGVWYDENTKTLHLARDIFGMFPLYYTYVPGNFVAFSTSLTSLLSMPPVKRVSAINHHRVASYLTFRGEQGKDYVSDTFYQHVKTVLPGNMLSIGPEESTSKPYFSFHLPHLPKLASAADCKEMFRDRLTASVSRNIEREDLLIGSHLSGGLDSSSVSALIKSLHPERTLHTFYYSTQKDSTYDQSFAVSVAKQIGSIHHRIVQSLNDFEIVQLYTTLHGYPQPGLISPASQDSLMKRASEIGCGLLLNGSDGDSIVGSGMELPEQTFYEKDWLLLKELLKKRVPFFTLASQYKNWNSLNEAQKTRIVENNFLYNRLSRDLHTKGILHVMETYRELRKYFDISVLYFLNRGTTALIKKIKGQSIQPITILREDFLRGIKTVEHPLHELSKSLGGTLPSNTQQWLRDVYTQTSISLNESRYILASHYGFQNRSPFYDKQLFELCMAIPPSIKFGNGLGRMHFREAMEGILPEHVRLRHQKTQVGTYGIDVTLRLYDQARDFMTESKEVWHYVDKELFNSSIKFLKIKGLPVDQYNRSMFHVTRAISLASWMDWLKTI